MEGGAVPSIARIDEDHGPVRLPALPQVPHQRLTVGALCVLLRRLGQDEDLQFRRQRIGALRQAKQVQMLRHHGGQGLEVVVTGGTVLGAAVVPHRRRASPPAGLIQIHPGHGLKGQVVHPGQQPVHGIPLPVRPQASAQVGDLVFLNAVLQGGVVDSDHQPEVLMARLEQNPLGLVGEPQLPLPGVQIGRQYAKGAVVILAADVHPCLAQLFHHIVVKLLPVPADRPPVALKHILQGQGIFRQGLPGPRAKVPYPIILLQRTAGISHSGGQPHDAVQQPYHIVRVLRQGSQQLL